MVTSCEDVNVNSPATGKGTINVHLTDAPAAYDEVNIDVQGLRIYHTPAADTADTSGSWIDLPLDPFRVDLLTLTDGIDTLLTSAELEPGHYRELRLLLGSNNDVVIDTTSHLLNVPSGQQSGYKIKFDTELSEGEELDVTIDFDAAQSVHMAGKSGKYMLKPVLKAIVESEE